MTVLTNLEFFELLVISVLQTLGDSNFFKACRYKVPHSVNGDISLTYLNHKIFLGIKFLKTRVVGVLLVTWVATLRT